MGETLEELEKSLKEENESTVMQLKHVQETENQQNKARHTLRYLEGKTFFGLGRRRGTDAEIADAARDLDSLQERLRAMQESLNASYKNAASIKSKLAILRDKSSTTSVAPTTTRSRVSERELGDVLAALRLGPGQMINTPSDQGPASGFSSDKPLKGFGYMCERCRFDAFGYVRSSLIPTDDDMMEGERLARKHSFSREGPFMVPLGEDDRNGIVHRLKAFCSTEFGLTHNKKTLSNLGIPFGVSTPKSIPDILWLAPESNEVLGVEEVKGAEGSLVHATRQGAVYGTHVALGLHQYVLENLVVPVVSYNGHTLAVGATCLLPGSTLPVYIPVSDVMDLTNLEGRIKAFAFLKRCQRHTEDLAYQVREAKMRGGPPPRPLAAMEFSLDDMYLKFLTQDTLERGLYLFCDEVAVAACDFLPGLVHMVDVLNALYESEAARKHVVFPLCLLTPGFISPDKNEKLSEVHALVYKDVTKDGYRMGAPSRRDDRRRFDAYVRELRVVLNAVHEAGVIHCDLYTSNVMWKENGDGVDILLIDWDTAHLKAEGEFRENVAARLRKYYEVSEVKLDEAMDLGHLEFLEDAKFADDYEEAFEFALCAREKKDLDDAYRALYLRWWRGSRFRQA